MKKYYVVAGAQLRCDQSLVPSVFFALNPLWNVSMRGVGRLTDFIPLFNVLPFGAPCARLSQMAGVPTPCVPFPLPWQGAHDSGRGSMLPVLLDTSTCRCSFGGKITVANAGQRVASYDGPVAPQPPDPPLPDNIVVYRPGDQQAPADQAEHKKQLAAAETQLNSPAKLPPNTLFLVDNYLYITDEHGKVVQAKGVLPPSSTGQREEYAQQQSVRYKDGWPNPRYVEDPRTELQRRKPQFDEPNQDYVADQRTPQQKRKPKPGKPNPLYLPDNRTKEQRRKPKTANPDYVPDPRDPDQIREFVDDGGHIFGTRFNGTGLHINYVPMHKNQNQSNVNGDNWFAMEERQANALDQGLHVYAEYEFEYPPEEPGTKKYGGYKKTPKRDFSMRPTTLKTKTWIRGKRDEETFNNN